MKDISIFGSTVSIGSNAVKLILTKKNDFNVVVLTGGKNIKKTCRASNIIKTKICCYCRSQIITRSN